MSEATATEKAKENTIGYSNIRKNSTNKATLRSKQEVQILAETSHGKVEKRAKVDVKREDKKTSKTTWKDKNTKHPDTHTPDMSLWCNEPFSLYVPKTKTSTTFTIAPDGDYSKNSYEIPLLPFMNALYDPVKIYYYQPTLASSTPKKPAEKKSFFDNLPIIDDGSSFLLNSASGGMSYFESMGIKPIQDDGSSMLFIQEMQTRRLNIPDGPVQISALDEWTTTIILQAMLGDNFESRIDKDKLKKEREEKYDRAKTGAGATYSSYDRLLKERILQDFGYKGTFNIQTTKTGKQYIIFKGYAGLRKHYNAPRYAATNPKVLNLTAAGQFKTAMKGNGITMIIVGTIDIVEWMTNKDNDKKFSDLCVQLGMDTLKMTVTSLIAAGLVAVILALLAGVTAPVLLVVAGTIGIGVIIGLGVDFLDTKTGATKYMKNQGRKGVTFLEKNETWQKHVVEPLGRLYYQMEKASEGLYLNTGSMVLIP